jgi:type II secretion system protein J
MSRQSNNIPRLGRGRIFKTQNNAFALVELLVAIAIFAVIITVVYTTLYTSVKAYQRTQRELELNQEISQVLDKLSVELRNCYDAEYNEEEDSGGFIADAQSMSFFTIQNIYSQEALRKSLARISYSFDDTSLFKKIQIDEDVFMDEDNFNEEELISGIQDFNIEYLYFKKEFFEDEYKYEWKEQWSDKALVPKGIRVKLARHDPKNNISINFERYIYIEQGEIGVQ